MKFIYIWMPYIYGCHDMYIMYIKVSSFKFGPICTNTYRRLSLKPRTGRLLGSSEVQVHKALYLSHYTTDSDEWTFFLHDYKWTRL